MKTLRASGLVAASTFALTALVGAPAATVCESDQGPVELEQN